MNRHSVLDLCKWIRTTYTRGSDRATLHALAHYANMDAECFPSLATIADEAGIGISTAKRALKNLEQRGLIRRKRRMLDDGNYTTTLYQLCVGSLGLTDEDCSDEDDPPASRPLSIFPLKASVTPRRKSTKDSERGWPMVGQPRPKAGHKATTEAIYYAQSSYPGSSGGGPAAPSKASRDAMQAFERGDADAAQHIARVLNRMKLRPDGQLAAIRDRAVAIVGE